jgi:hypothetical protein
MLLLAGKQATPSPLPCLSLWARAIFGGMTGALMSTHRHPILGIMSQRTMWFEIGWQAPCMVRVSPVVELRVILWMVRQNAGPHTVTAFHNAARRTAGHESSVDATKQTNKTSKHALINGLSSCYVLTPLFRGSSVMPV